MSCKSVFSNKKIVSEQFLCCSLPDKRVLMGLTVNLQLAQK